MTTQIQSELIFPAPGMSIEEMLNYLNEKARRPVAIKLTRNRVSMITIDFSGDGPVKVRMHEKFLRAPEKVVGALRNFIRTKRRAAWSTVSSFAGAISASPGDNIAGGICAQGKTVDLKSMFRDVNNQFFSGKVKCRIGWGKKPARRGGRRKSKSIRFGSWNPATKIIRIHPMLDSERVPFEFVRYIVFHEMLHTVVPSSCTNGRRTDHTAAFRTLERAFPRLDDMMVLSRELLEELT